MLLLWRIVMTRFLVFWAPGVQILQILCDILFCYINMIMFFISFFWTAYNFFWRILQCRIPVMVLKWKSNNFKFFCQRLTVNYPPPPFSNLKCSRNINFKDKYNLFLSAESEIDSKCWFKGARHAMFNLKFFFSWFELIQAADNKS